MEVLFGTNAVWEAIVAGRRRVEKVLLSQEAHGGRLQRIEEEARHRGIPVLRRERRHLDEIAPGQHHQGVVALVAAVAYEDLEGILAGLAGEAPLLVLADGVEDPGNLGALIRTAAGAGVHAVVIPERRACGLTPAVARAAAGALERVPVARQPNLARTAEELKERGIWVLGLDMEGELRWDEPDYRLPTALVVGGEGKGLRPLLRERCDARVRLPLAGGVESLNVAVAAGIVLYEAVRQRARGR